MKKYIKHTSTFILVIITLYLIWDILHSLHVFLYCDSGSIQDFLINERDINYEVNDINNNKDIKVKDNHLNSTYLSFADRIRRRISWYVVGKNKADFKNYNEYKEAWNPNIKLRSELKSFFKDDINKSLDTKPNDGSRLMADIKAARNADAQARLNKYLERVNNRKK
jgi:hypothetical protein